MNGLQDFYSRMRMALGSEYAAFETALNMPPSVSLRLNPQKIISLKDNDRIKVYLDHAEHVPWCKDGRYLAMRPSFTLDPLLHAGAYYVQEAASMFIEQIVSYILAHHVPFSDGCLTAMDLCAAPGGKSTHLLSLLPKGSLLVCNEVVRRRCMILVENMAKWGLPNYIVTNSDPSMFGSLPYSVDLILADMPCSGEGMFRKDIAARKSWSIDNVRLCAARQRRIVHDVWDALKPGGWFIYSTCTFNVEENEDNVIALADALDAEIMPIPIEPEWNIGGALRHNIPVCRFYPHRTRSEGFFVALLRKREVARTQTFGTVSIQKIKDLKNQRLQSFLGYQKRVNIVSTDVSLGELKVAGHDKEKNIVPSAALALSVTLRRSDFPSVELSYEDAIRYLRKETFVLPSDTKKGHILVTFCDLPLGFVKNIGSRANNLYPMEWRIRHDLTI